MKHLGLLLFFVPFFISAQDTDKYKTSYETTVTHRQDGFYATVKVRIIYDAFFGEPTVKAIAKVIDHSPEIEVGVLNVRADIMQGPSVVATDTYKNLISFDVSGSPGWDELWPGVSAARAKEIYKQGYQISNVRLLM